MKKAIVAISVLLVMAIGTGLYFQKQMKTSEKKVRLTFTFADNKVRYNWVNTSCLEAIGSQDPLWQMTKASTCGSLNRPCIVEGRLNNHTMEFKSCEFNVEAPSGINGNPTPSFVTIEGWGTANSLVGTDNGEEKFQDFSNIHFQFCHNDEVISAQVYYILHIWGANYKVDF